jgi:bacterioferritin
MSVPTRSAAVSSFANSKTLRRMVPANSQKGAAAESYRGDRPTVLRLLNEALATALVCGLRYRRHHFMARDLASKRIAEEFLVHADEELSHADLIAERIVQLGGQPDFAPATLQQRSHAQYVAVDSVIDMLREDIVAERIAIDSYRGLIEYVGEHDATTRRMLEGILAVERAHADELSDLLQAKPRDRP